jgi:lipoprotein signal peptidase
MAKAEKKEKQAGVLKGHWLWGALVLCVLLLIDLGTKIAAQVYFDILGNKDIVLIPGVIELTYTENPGMAFSMGADANPTAKLAVIIGTAVVMLGCIIFYLCADKRRSWLRWCLVFIVAGGIGNLIDRVLFETWLNNGRGVRDMVLLDFSTLLESWFQIEPTKFLDFGVCNFADFFVVGGAIAMIFAMLFFDTGAFFPKGKYKALAKEADEKAEAKAKAKAERKNAGE